MTEQNIAQKFPRTVNLAEGEKVEVRLMSADDRDAVLAFAQALPEEDLLFLRLDLTDPAVVDEWVANVESGHSISLLAYDQNGVIGYATVHRNRARWMRRVGEIRVNVGPGYRSKGLGRFLTSQIFDVAREIGLKKLMANMTIDQRGAQAAFRRLGFVPEALLADYVEDQQGNPRDLVVMSYDIDGHSEQVDEPVRL
ncbi:MAG: GNAT family N-acetyltransferase [Gammaproteobacteria bacterium]|nr:MAG: GNAT family N-acetyltransferase [Gammaproteobacteria bacterium]TDJ38232.1 MAG: GNAT family N-acetyltransferase [Gammaproteobacteria bacterium]